MTQYRQMTALGSSFAAGPSITPVINTAAMRSGRNYPHRLADLLGAHLIDATVSGATTSTILDDSQTMGPTTFPPQVQSVRPDDDLVTVTAGGNDLGYITGILGAALRNSGAEFPGLEGIPFPGTSDAIPGEEAVTATAEGLERIVRTVRHLAPKAQVVLVGYLPVLEEDPALARGAHLQPEDVVRSRAVGELVAQAYRIAADRSGALLVDGDDYAAGHGLGTPEPWVQGLNALPDIAGSFHPNEAGMHAVAQAVHRRLLES